MAAVPMDPTGTVPVTWTLAPAASCKRIHLIRHGQAEHNVAALSNPNAYKEERFLDCPLTEFGRQQATHLGEKLRAQPPNGFPVELVVSSPLQRTLQTATLIFPAPSVDSTEAAAPIVANELCREGLVRLAPTEPAALAHVHLCDRRSPISRHRDGFPHIDFAEIASEEDVLWQPASETRGRETPQEIAARASEFIQWLLQRPESSIAVISHSGFLRHLLLTSSATYSANKEDIYFDNCELRSFVLAG